MIVNLSQPIPSPLCPLANMKADHVAEAILDIRQGAELANVDDTSTTGQSQCIPGDRWLQWQGEIYIEGSSLWPWALCPKYPPP